MKITQTPQNANEFRYLQFAWKAVDSTVTGITMEIGNVNGGNVNSLASLYCGTWCGLDHVAVFVWAGHPNTNLDAPCPPAGRWRPSISGSCFQNQPSPRR